jgi:hypothetical protein
MDIERMEGKMKRNKVLCFITALLFCGLVITVIPITASKANAADDGLVLHLKFDNDALDASGNSNNGTCYGNITYDSGVLGSAAVFDGASYIEVKDADTLDLQKNFTISLWAYKEYSEGNFVPYVFKEKDASTSFAPYKLYDHWLNSPNMFLHGKDINQFSLSGTMLDIDQWNLITVTYDGSKVYMYYNGKLIANKSATGTPAITTGNLIIGLMDSKKFYYKGKMDDLRIYNRAVSAQEVTDLYNAGNESNPTALKMEKGIAAHYEFEGNYEDSSSYKNNGELLSESESVAFVPAIVGKGLQLGDGSYIDVKDSNSLNMQEGFTVSTWVYKAVGSPMPIIHRLNSSMVTKPNSLDYNLILWDDVIDFNYQPFISNTSFKSSRMFAKTNLAGQWFHVALTGDNKELRWYFNGKLAKKEDVANLEVANSWGSLMIGTDGSKFFSGVLDELKIFNYTLTADEVKAEYNKQDTLSISTDNEKKIKGLKAKTALSLTVNRNYVATGDSEKISKDITFTSSNNKIFKESKNGKLTAVKKGSATLTISHGGISKSYKITVK